MNRYIKDQLEAGIKNVLLELLHKLPLVHSVKHKQDQKHMRSMQI